MVIVPTPYNIPIIPFKLVTNTFGMNLQLNTLLEIEENPFLSIEQPNITIIPVLQRIGLRITDRFMAFLCIPGGHNISLKTNTTISYMKELDYRDKSKLTNRTIIGKMTKISHERIPPMPEKSAFLLHHNFTQIQDRLKNDKITKEMRQELQLLKQVNIVVIYNLLI